MLTGNHFAGDGGKVIVTTTINPPTLALRKFAEQDGWTLVVVGDLKTPDDFYIEGAVFLTPETQQSSFPELSELIGWNSIQRRNIGFLWALEAGAEIIASVDDDNIPIDGWGENLLLGQESELTVYSGPSVCDPFSPTNYPHLWHRGYPLQLLQMKQNLVQSREKLVPQVQADFWNGDPDVDAICRLEHAPDCEFNDEPFPFGFSGLSPFNSQNTFLVREALKEYFMFPFVGRMDDIWGAYLLEARGFRAVYSRASVYQQRNEHDLMKDFEGEIVGYQNSLALCEALLQDPEKISSFIPERSESAYRHYLAISRSL